MRYPSNLLCKNSTYEDFIINDLRTGLDDEWENLGDGFSLAIDA
jgi:hypothetical protein